jgi:hypothetical protein
VDRCHSCNLRQRLGKFRKGPTMLTHHAHGRCTGVLAPAWRGLFVPPIPL